MHVCSLFLIWTFFKKKKKTIFMVHIHFGWWYTDDKHTVSVIWTQDNKYPHSFTAKDHWFDLLWHEPPQIETRPTIYSTFVEESYVTLHLQWTFLTKTSCTVYIAKIHSNVSPVSLNIKNSNHSLFNIT